MRWRGEAGEGGLTWLRRQLGLGLPASWSSIVGGLVDCTQGVSSKEDPDAPPHFHVSTDAGARTGLCASLHLALARTLQSIARNSEITDTARLDRSSASPAPSSARNFVPVAGR